jgi:hypothetical protein
MTIQFNSALIRSPASRLTFLIEGNSKISGTQLQPNAFSLPAGLTCPGSTEACRAACYATDGEHPTKLTSELRRQYEQNFETIETILKLPDRERSAEATALGGWISENCKDVGFRWHVSGDVHSFDYALWILKVCASSPSIQHWIYTRTLPLVSVLTRASNLEVTVSADVDNYRLARLSWRCQIGTVRFSYLWRGESIPTDLPPCSVVFPDYSQRNSAARGSIPGAANLCHADFYGQSDVRRCGVCTRCGNPLHPRRLALVERGHSGS